MQFRAPMVVLALLMLLPSALAAWPVEGGDVGRTAGTTLPIPTKDVAQVWNASGQYTGVFVAADGSVVGVGDPVAVFEPDGTTRWSTRTLADGKVYRARGGGLLSDGTIVTVGHLALGGASAVAYDPADGSQRWTMREFGRSCDSPEEVSIAVGADDSMYAGHCGDGPGIVAIRKDGALKWKYTGEADRVALGGTNVYARVKDIKAPNGTVHEDTIAAFSQADGSVVWVSPDTKDLSESPIVGADGTVYTVDAGYVTALFPSNGSAKWRTIVPRPFAIGIAPNGTIAAASSNVVSWLAPADGKLLGATPSRDGSPILLGNGLHVRMGGAAIFAIDDAGRTLWQVNGTSRTFQSNLAVGNEGALYAAEDGQLRAYVGEGGASAPTPTPASPTSVSPPAASTPAASAEGEKGTPGPALAPMLAVVAVAAGILRRR